MRKRLTIAVRIRLPPVRFITLSIELPIKCASANFLGLVVAEYQGYFVSFKLSESYSPIGEKGRPLQDLYVVAVPNLKDGACCSSVSALQKRISVLRFTRQILVDMYGAQSPWNLLVLKNKERQVDSNWKLKAKSFIAQFVSQIDLKQPLHYDKSATSSPYKEHCMGGMLSCEASIVAEQAAKFASCMASRAQYFAVEVGCGATGAIIGADLAAQKYAASAVAFAAAVSGQYAAAAAAKMAVANAQAVHIQRAAISKAAAAGERAHAIVAAARIESAAYASLFRWTTATQALGVACRKSAWWIPEGEGFPPSWIEASTGEYGAAFHAAMVWKKRALAGM